MQLPYRKPGKYAFTKNDPMLTQGKFDELKKKLEGLKKIKPEAAREVARLAELGDFSENVEYQLAKGRLRGINNMIQKLEMQLNQAEIIRPNSKADRVELGSTVTIHSAGKQKTYQILGSSEANPGKGIISQSSPIGAALLGKKLGDEVKIIIADKMVSYQIVNIE